MKIFPGILGEVWKIFHDTWKYIGHSISKVPYLKKFFILNEMRQNFVCVLRTNTNFNYLSPKYQLSVFSITFSTVVKQWETMSSITLEGSKLEQWSVIRFLSFENRDLKPIKIYEWLKNVYDNSTMSIFREGKENVEDEYRVGRPQCLSEFTEHKNQQSHPSRPPRWRIMDLLSK